MSDEDVDGSYLMMACQELERLDVGQLPQRGPIDEIWRRIGENKLSEAASAAWASTIAARVVRDVIDERNPPQVRPERALKALGFFGGIDMNYKQRETLKQFLTFDRLASLLDPRRPSASRQDKLIWMRAQGFYKGLSDSAAKQRIDRLEENSR